MQEMLAELVAKYGTLNRGLKPGIERPLSNPEPQQTPTWKKIYDEFLAKIAAKKAKKD